MPANLCIQVTSMASAEWQEIEFFHAEEWSADSEEELLVNIRNILALVRNVGKTCDIRINLQVNDLQTAVFLIRKKASAHIEINQHKLSIREMEILGLIMNGLTNNEIAGKLFISYETVKSHRKNILGKTGAKNTAALINYYHQAFFEK
jgi:DNA-binding CsgD family transcriptional regulator